MTRTAVLIGGTAAAVAALAVAVNASGSSPTASASKTQTIRLLAVQTSSHVVDNPPLQLPNEPPSAGDIVTFTDSDFSHGKRVGHDDLALVSTGRGRLAGTGTLFLRKGHIVVSDTFDVSKKRQRQAITGGTGIYRNARGDVTVTQLSRTRTGLVIRISR